MANALLEIPIHDQEINSRLQTMFGLVEDELRAVLKEHIASGDFGIKQSSEQLARFLMAGIYGLRVFNKTQPDTSASFSFLGSKPFQYPIVELDKLL